MHLSPPWLPDGPDGPLCSIDRVYLRSIGVAWMAGPSMAGPSPGHDEEGTAAERQRTERQRTRRRRCCGANTPCTRTGRRVGQQSSTPDGSLRQAGDRRSGRQANKWNHRCTPMHTDGLESGMLVQSQTQPAARGEQRGRVGPDSISVHPCASVVPFACLCCRVPQPAPRAFGSRCAAKTPCTCSVPRPEPPAVSPGVQ